MRRLVLSLLLPVGVLLVFPSNVKNINEHLFIVSLPDECDYSLEGSHACMTLSSFAANTSDYSYLQLNSNASKLILYPGNHTLHSKLAIAHINQLWIYSKISRSVDTNIVCINHAARFEFTNITRIHFSNVKFLGCGGNRAESVMNFSLINTIFDGQNQYVIDAIGRALELVNSSLLAERSSFVSNIDGGAVVVNGSNATFLNCNFEGNRAEVGGAIYGNFSSNVSITNSTFYRNSAERCGGAIYVGSLIIHGNDSITGRGMLSIHTSSISDNEAEVCGGGVAVFHVNISTYKTEFTNNLAKVDGGAILSNKSGIANISETNFTDNSNNAPDDCGGAMHVFNSTLLISNSNFNRNLAVNGHGGALCLQEGTNYLSDCDFNFNEAETFGGAIYTRNSQHEYLTRCSFDTNTIRSQSGGGRSMRIYREPNVVIIDSSFIDSGYFPFHDGHKGNISNCQESNEGYKVSGVGMIMTSSTVLLDNTSFEGSCESIYAYKCNVNFTGNSSFIGIVNEPSKAPSALYIIQSTVSIDGMCEFMNNTAVSGGAIHAAESRLDVNGELVIANNSALENGGGIYLYRSDFNCRINSGITITDNSARTEGGGIHAISSTIKVTYVRDSCHGRSSLFFERNRACNGGGLYLEANAKLLVLKEGSNRDNLTHNSSIFFRANEAKESGGAVYVADETNVATCEGKGATGSRHSDSTECFFQIVTVMLTELVRNNGDLVAIEFESNWAPIGPLLFGGLLDRCTLSPIAELHKVDESSREHFGISGPGITYLLHISNIMLDDVKSHDIIRSKSVLICFCVGNTSDCSYRPPPVKVTHGIEFNISLVAVDQVNRTVENVTIFSSMESSNNWLNKGQIVQNTSKGCTNLTFSILSSGNLSLTIPYNDTLLLYADGPCKSADRSKQKLQILLQPCKCAIGFQISSDRDKCNCECDKRLKEYTTICNVTKGVLMRQKNSNFWISTITSIENTLNFCTSGKYLAHLNCPFDYCIPGNSIVEVNLSRSDGSDVQCANNRVGLLCSQCKPGYSLSVGSSSCIRCSKFWMAQMIGILLAVSIAGIILVTLLLVLNLTVAVGTINGLIFYANIVGSTSEPLTFALPQFVVAWLNLESGFDGCFINGLNAYWRTWLKFAFPTYVFFLVASVIVLSRFSPKFSRIIGKRNPVTALNTLILLSYSKLLNAVISIFLFTTLDCPGGSSRSVKVWVVDATIEYLSPKHFALFVVAIVILFSGTVYTFLLFSWQWLLLYQDKWLFRWVGNQKLCQFLEPYHAPYTFKHRYWTGLLLLVCVVLFTILAANTSQDPYVSLVAISIAISSLFLFKGIFSRVYRNHLSNILESFCLINILFLCIANFYTITKGHSKMQKDLAYVSGSTITLLFIFVTAYHVYTEIIMKSKIWIVLNDLMLKSKAMIRDVASIHRTVTSAPPLSYTTSVVDAPKNDEQLGLKHGGFVEPNLRELLLESSADGTLNFLY